MTFSDTMNRSLVHIYHIKPILILGQEPKSGSTEFSIKKSHFSAGRAYMKGEKHKIKVLGAGNYLMADDGVGVHILEKLEQSDVPGVEFENAGVGGLAVLDLMEDADDVIIIDAVRGGGGPPGSIYKFTDKDLPPAQLFMMSLHDLNLVDTMALGHQIQPELMPDNITIIGIEVERVEGICTELSPRVQKAADEVMTMVFNEIERFKALRSDGKVNGQK